MLLTPNVAACLTASRRMDDRADASVEELKTIFYLHPGLEGGRDSGGRGGKLGTFSNGETTEWSA
jgi:hypothetical protein